LEEQGYDEEDGQANAAWSGPGEDDHQDDGAGGGGYYDGQEYDFENMKVTAELANRASDLMDALGQQGPKRDRWIKEYVSKELEDRRVAESECFDEVSHMAWSDQGDRGQAEKQSGDGHGGQAEARDEEDGGEGQGSSQIADGWDAEATTLSKSSNGSRRC
jgi:hypothetical protein